MTFEQVVLLLTLLGGAIYMTASALRKQAVILFDLTPEER